MAASGRDGRDHSVRFVPAPGLVPAVPVALMILVVPMLRGSGVPLRYLAGRPDRVWAEFSRGAGIGDVDEVVCSDPRIWVG